MPIVGRGLLTASDEGRETLLYPQLARRLAKHLDVSAADLPRDGELDEVARRYLARSADVQILYRDLRVILRELDELPVPPALVQLARISEFKLYLTTTFDSWVERALNQERFEGQRQTLVFSHAPNDRQDLPREFERLNRPAVFHLMGRISGTPHSFAVTAEDTADFLHSLQSKTEDSPNFLFDELKRSNVLILGSRIADWLVRFFVRNTTGGRYIETKIDFVTDGEVERDRGEVLFLQHFGAGTKIFRGCGAAEFVNELYRRWSERQPVEGTGSPPPVVQLISSPEERAGAIYLCCVHEDRNAAESIRDALDSAGVDVILDSDDSQLADRWDEKLRSCIGECALFVPIVSTHAAKVQRRFFQDEWVEAILEARKAAPSERFIMPVVIDDTKPPESAMPEGFGELDWEELLGGKPSSKFVETVVRLQRRFRSVRLA